jgi:16S rRNA (uracil1498-N3)-methyltransferase
MDNPLPVIRADLIMPRIYLPVLHFANNRISITGEKARYLTSVLRCRKGDDLIVFGGGADCFRTIVSDIGRQEVIVEVTEKFLCNLESPVRIILAQALLKGEKMDMVIQKTTELGITEIVPVITSRSQLRETRKLSRWRKIAEEASRQSGRNVIPVIHEPVQFAGIFSDQTSPFKAGLILYEENGMKLSKAEEALKHALNGAAPPFAEGRLLVVIGPEGGFTGEEIALAREKGLLVVSLGQRILRAETAAISAVTLVQFLFGDMG